MNFCDLKTVSNPSNNVVSFGGGVFGKKLQRKSPYDGDKFIKTETVTNASKAVSDKGNYSGIAQLAAQLTTRADGVFKIFKYKMQLIFGDYCKYPANPSPSKDVGTLKICTKSPKSLIDKLAQKGINSADDAKAQISDIIRGRIILNTGSQKEGDEICAQLIKAVRKGDVRIKEIKDYRSDDKMAYISKSKLDELEEMCAKMSGSCTRTNKRKNTGYNGVHILFTLDDGFSGELQIMGKHTEKLKDVEDVYYKLIAGKKVAPEFKEIADLYEQVKSNPKYDVDDLTRYIHEAYSFERDRELGHAISIKTKFLPLDTTKYKLPEQFDFNYIAKLMKETAKKVF